MKSLFSCAFPHFFIHHVAAWIQIVQLLKRVVWKQCCVYIQARKFPYQSVYCFCFYVFGLISSRGLRCSCCLCFPSSLFFFLTCFFDLLSPLQPSITSFIWLTYQWFEHRFKREAGCGWYTKSHSSKSTCSDFTSLVWIGLCYFYWRWRISLFSHL